MLLTWACFTFFAEWAVITATVDTITNKLLMSIGHSFRDIFEALHPVCQIFKVIMFSFKPHAPEANQWAIPTIM